MVKSGEEPVGPGPNWFGDSPDNVWVDDRGDLHLRVYKQEDRWYCAEVVSSDHFSYGQFQFQIVSKLDQLDPNLVLGLFSWSDKGINNREIDIEFSKWSDPATEYSGQYVIQPAHQTGNRFRFPIHQEGWFTTHQFYWYPEIISFASYHGHVQANDQQATPIKFWNFTGKPPKPKKTQIRINLWLNQGQELSNHNEFEVIIRGFSYKPLSR